MSVYRVYVEKKTPFAVEAQGVLAVSAARWVSIQQKVSVS